MSSTTTHFDLPLLTANQAQPEVPLNESLELIDAALYAVGGSISVKQVGDSPAGNASKVTALHFVGATVTPQTDGVALITIEAGTSSDTTTESLPAGGTTGQVLAKTSGADYAVSWETVSSGGGSGATFLNANIDPDSHVTASAYTDEFEETSLSTQWTWTNQSSSVAPLLQGLLELTTNGAGLQYIAEPAPATFTIIFKQRVPTASAGVAGFVLYNSGNTKAIVVGPWFSPPSGNAGALNLTAGAVTSAAFNFTVPGAAYTSQFIYYKIVNDGTTLTVSYSLSGYAWDFTTAGSVALSAFIGAVTHFGIGAYSTAALLQYVDFFRDVTGGYTPASGNTITGGSGNVTPDTHPAIANAMDDEFEGMTLDSKWTVWNQASNPFTHALTNGAVNLVVTNAGNTDYQGIYQALPSGTAWKFRTKLAGYGWNGNTQSGGMLLYESSTGKFIIAGILNNANPSVWMAYYASYSSTSQTGYVGFSSFALSALPSTMQLQPMYLELELAAGSIYLRFSYSGLDNTWVTVGSFEFAITAAFTTAPDSVGLSLMCNSGIGFADFDWFRRTA